MVILEIRTQKNIAHDASQNSYAIHHKDVTECYVVATSYYLLYHLSSLWIQVVIFAPIFVKICPGIISRFLALDTAMAM